MSNMSMKMPVKKELECENKKQVCAMFECKHKHAILQKQNQSHLLGLDLYSDLNTIYWDIIVKKCSDCKKYKNSTHSLCNVMYHTKHIDNEVIGKHGQFLTVIENETIASLTANDSKTSYVACRIFSTFIRVKVLDLENTGFNRMCLE